MIKFLRDMCVFTMCYYIGVTAAGGLHQPSFPTDETGSGVLEFVPDPTQRGIITLIGTVEGNAESGYAISGWNCNTAGSGVYGLDFSDMNNPKLCGWSFVELKEIADAQRK